MNPAQEMSFQQRSLFQQGYYTYSPKQLKELEWGLRFTPAACSLVALYAYVEALPGLLAGVALLGLWAFFAPAAHPMDLLYNHGVRRLFGSTAMLPPNPLQRRLACLSAGLMNSAGAVLFYHDMPLAARINGGVLLTLQAIVIFTHFCTLSYLYEGLLRLLGRWDKPVEPQTAVRLLREGGRLVDVRGPDEHAHSPLKGAVNLPLDALESMAESLKGERLFLHCQSGVRSQIAFHKLKALGLEQVYDLGGLERARALLAEAGRGD